jgi:CubicO group peptidase (beta-lactamase class C family)
MMRSGVAWFLLSTLASAGVVRADELPPATAARIDSVFAEWSGTHTPGCAIAIMRDDQVVFARGYGMANLEHQIAITPETVFGLQSTSKQFIAMAVVLLIQDGKLAFDDDVRKYVPELPDYGHTITIRHLLEHTSGLRDLEILLQDEGWGSDETLSDKYLLDLVARQKALNHPPGAAASYSNTGYFLLPLVVERVTKQRLADFMAARIFQPLGMTQSLYRDNYRAVIPNSATGYRPSEKKGDGAWEASGNSKDAVFSTVLDLARWNANFDHAVVGGEEAIRWLTTWGKLRTGEQTEWGLGLSPLHYRGLDGYYFSGGGHDGTSVFVRFPDQRFALAILANGSLSYQAESFAPPVIDIVLADEIAAIEGRAAAKVPPDTTGVALASGEFARYAGLYFTTQGGPQTREFRLIDGRPVMVLPSQRTNNLVFRGGGRFRVKGATTEYVFDNDQVRRVIDDGPDRIFQRVDSTRTAMNLADFAGTYWNDEIAADVTFSMRDGKLDYAFPRQDAPTPLTPVFRDAFADGELVFRFVRDSHRKVIGVTKHWDRVWNLAYVRQAR